MLNTVKCGGGEIYYGHSKAKSMHWGIKNFHLLQCSVHDSQENITYRIVSAPLQALSTSETCGHR